MRYISSVSLFFRLPYECRETNTANFEVDEMREKISLLDDTTADLISGLDDITESPGGDSARSSRVRKRRS